MGTRSRGGDKVTIKIPRPLYERIAGAIDGGGYDSVTDFVVHVLRDVVSTHEVRERGDEEHSPISEQDLERVKERLRALGYL
jgi:Arc/MetJ-type ribon-helix-helix transcriptional regulator